MNKSCALRKNRVFLENTLTVFLNVFKFDVLNYKGITLVQLVSCMRL